MFPDKNFIGVDIKGSRMWSGASDSLKEGLNNVAFLRTNIEIIDRFFAEGEVSEIWLTFSDPQMKKATKRLTSTYFMLFKTSVGLLLIILFGLPFTYTLNLLLPLTCILSSPSTVTKGTFRNISNVLLVFESGSSSML